MAGNDAVVNLKINADAIVQDINKVKRAIDKLSAARGNKGKSIPKISPKVGKKLGEKPDKPLADTRTAKGPELTEAENLIKARAKLVALAQRELQIRAQVAQNQPNAKKPEDVFGRQEMPSFRKISTGAQQALGIKPGSKEEATFNKELKAATASLSSKTSGLSLDDLVKDFKVKADKVLTGQGLPKSTTTTFQKDVIPQEPTPKAKPAAKPAAAKPAAASGPAASGPAAKPAAKPAAAKPAPASEPLKFSPGYYDPATRGLVKAKGRPAGSELTDSRIANTPLGQVEVKKTGGGSGYGAGGYGFTAPGMPTMEDFFKTVKEAEAAAQEYMDSLVAKTGASGPAAATKPAATGPAAATGAAASGPSGPKKGPTGAAATGPTPKGPSGPSAAAAASVAAQAAALGASGPGPTGPAAASGPAATGGKGKGKGKGNKKKKKTPSEAAQDRVEGQEFSAEVDEEIVGSPKLRKRSGKAKVSSATSSDTLKGDEARLKAIDTEFLKANLSKLEFEKFLALTIKRQTARNQDILDLDDKILALRRKAVLQAEARYLASPQAVDDAALSEKNAQSRRALRAGKDIAAIPSESLAAQKKIDSVTKKLSGLSGTQLKAAEDELILQYKIIRANAKILGDTELAAAAKRKINQLEGAEGKRIAAEKRERDKADTTSKRERKKQAAADKFDREAPQRALETSRRAVTVAESPLGQETQANIVKAQKIRQQQRDAIKAEDGGKLGPFGRFTSRFGLNAKKDQTAASFFGSGALTSVKYAVPSMALFGAASGMSKSLKEAEQFKVELDKIQEQVDATNWAKYGSDSKTAFTEIKASIIAISKETGLQLDVVASLTQQLIGAFAGETIGNQGGLELVTSQVESAAKIAIATDLAPKEITDGLTAASLSFGRTFEEIGDVAVALERSSGVLGRETIAFIGDIAPVAKEAGFSLEEFSALAATAQQRSGKSGAALAENFGRIIPAISENKDKLLQLAVASDALRTPEFINAVNNSDIQGTLTTIAKEYENLNDKSKQFVVSLLGGKREAQALIPALANNEVLEKLTQAAEDSSGSLETRYRKVLSSLTVATKALVQQMHVLAMELLDSGLTDGLELAVQLAGGLVLTLSKVLKVVGEINKAFGGLPGIILAAALATKGIGLAGRKVLPARLTSIAGLTGKGATPEIVAARKAETAATVQLTLATKALEAAQFDQGLSGKALLPFEQQKIAATNAQTLALVRLEFLENQLAASRVRGAAAAPAVVAAQSVLTIATEAYVGSLAQLVALEELGTLSGKAHDDLNLKITQSTIAKDIAQADYNKQLAIEQGLRTKTTGSAGASALAGTALQKTKSGGTGFLKLVGGGSVLGGSLVLGVSAIAATYLGFKKHAEDIAEKAKETVKLEKDTTEKILKELEGKPEELKQAKEGRVDVLRALKRKAKSQESAVARFARNLPGVSGETEAQLLQDEIDKLTVSPEKQKALDLLKSGNVAYDLSRLKPAFGRPTGAFETAIAEVQRVSDLEINAGITDFSKAGQPQLTSETLAPATEAFSADEKQYLKDLADFLGLNSPEELTADVVQMALQDKLRFVEGILSIAEDGRYLGEDGKEGERASKETEALVNNVIKNFEQRKGGGQSQADANAVLQKEFEKLYGKAAGVKASSTVEELKALLDSGGISRNQFIKGYKDQIDKMKEIIADGGSVVDDKFLALFRQTQKESSEEISKTVSAQVETVKRFQGYSGNTDIQRQQEILKSVVSGLATTDISSDVAGQLALEYIDIQKSIMDTRIKNAFNAQEAVNIANSKIDIPVDAQLGLLRSSLQQLTGSYEAFNQAFLARSGETADMFLKSILQQISSGQITIAQAREQLIERLKVAAAEKAQYDALLPTGTPEPAPPEDYVPPKQVPTPKDLKDPKKNLERTIDGILYRYNAKSRKWEQITKGKKKEKNKTVDTESKRSLTLAEGDALGLPSARPTNKSSNKAAETIADPNAPVPEKQVRTKEQEQALKEITLVIETIFQSLGLDTFSEDAQIAADEATKKEAKKLLQAERQAQFGLFAAMKTFNGELISAAETNVTAAREAVADATNATELASAQSNLISAQKALEDAINTQRAAEYGFWSAMQEFNGDIVGAAETNVIAAREAVANARGVVEIAAAESSLLSAQKELENANNTQRAAQFALFSAVIAKDDPIAQAKISLVQAQQLASEARGITAQADAARNLLEVQKQLTEAMNAARMSQFNLRQAELSAMGDDVGAAQVAAQAARQQLADVIAAGAGSAAINQARAATIGADKSARDAIFSDKMDDYKWLLDMGKITKSQYANYLEGLKATLIPGTKQFKDLELTIKQLKNDIGSDLQQNLPTSLALPTLYEVRRLDQVSQTRDANGRAGIGYQDNRTQDIKIYVNNGMGESEVVQVLSDALGTGRSGSGPRRY